MLLAGLLVLTGCGYITPIAETTTTLDIGTIEDAYIAALTDWSLDQPRLTVVDVSTDAELIELGWLTCLELEAGTTHEEFARRLVADYDDDEFLSDLAVILGTANGIMCPWESGK